MPYEIKVAGYALLYLSIFLTAVIYRLKKHKVEDEPTQNIAAQKEDNPGIGSSPHAKSEMEQKRKNGEPFPTHIPISELCDYINERDNETLSKTLNGLP